MTKSKLAIFLTAACLALPVAAIAAGSANIKTEEGDTPMSWLDASTARINMPDGSDYLLVRDQRLYVVSSQGGKPQVMDLTDLGQAMMAMADDKLIAEVDVDNIKSVEDTGKTKEVAGIKGDIYNITVVNKEGKEETKEVVLTDDTTVTELTQVYVNLLKTVMGNSDVEQALDKLPKNKRGLLKVEDGFELESISDQAPDSSQLELPAKPKSMQDLLSAIGK